MIFRILLLIGLTCCVSAGEFEVQADRPFYEGEENKDVTLEWTFTPSPLDSLTISCDKFVGHHRFMVFEMFRGSEVAQDETDPFAGRVQYDADALKEGRLSLTVSSLTAGDSGFYECEVKSHDDWAIDQCQLQVNAAK